MSLGICSRCLPPRSTLTDSLFPYTPLFLSLIAAGQLRYLVVSNYPGWQLMKAQAAADRLGAPRFVAHQVYYSLIGRAYEADLMPLAADQGDRKSTRLNSSH